MAPAKLQDRRDRRPRIQGMTITELLVVVVVLLLLLVAVAPNLRPSDSQKGREAAATLFGMVSRVKSRAALDEQQGAGIWLQPLESRADVVKVVGNFVVTPPSRGVMDLFVSKPQDPYIGDDPESAKVHVNSTLNVRTLASLPPIDSALPNTDAIVTFSTEYCPLVREFCSSASRIEIGRNSGRTYFFTLLSSAQQAALENTNPFFFPKPYRPCNAPVVQPSDDDYEDPSRRKGVPPTPTKYYDDSDSGRINFDRSRIIIGMIRQPAGTALPDSPAPFDPGNQIPPSPPLPPSGYPGIDAGVSFSIVRPNTRAPTPPLSLPAGYVVDVAWSMIDSTRLLNNSQSMLLGTVATKPGITITAIDNFLSNEPIQLMFDSNGNLKSAIYKVMLRGFGVPGAAGGSIVEEASILTGDVYLLVGRADRAGQAFDPAAPSPADDTLGANWQHPDSRWVRISRSGGTALIADPRLNAFNVYDSQDYARQGISAVRN